MSTRAGYWLSGVVVGIGLFGMVCAAAMSGGFAIYFLYGIETDAFFWGFFAMGIFGEIVARWRAWRSRGPKPAGRYTSPADGVVEVVPIPDARGEPNPCDTRFRRFVALESSSSVRKPGRPSRTMPPLMGRVAFASLFLGRYGKGWNHQEIARTHDSLIRAGEWIEREAIRLGAAVNIVVADLYFSALDPVREEAVEIAILPEGDGEGLYDADAEVKLVASASRAAASMGFRDVADLAGSVASRMDADAVVWLIHPRSVGRSFVVPESDTGMIGVSLAICYAREDDFPGPLAGLPFADPSTFAHEILHLFGATDKYGVPLSSFPKGSVTRAEIMRLDESKLSRLRVDPMTAKEIGWA